VGDNRTYAKLSVTPVIKRDISAVTALNILGTEPTISKIGHHAQAKDGTQWSMIEALMKRKPLSHDPLLKLHNSKPTHGSEGWRWQEKMYKSWSCKTL